MRLKQPKQRKEPMAEEAQRRMPQIAAAEEEAQPLRMMVLAAGQSGQGASKGPILVQAAAVQMQQRAVHGDRCARLGQQTIEEPKEHYCLAREADRLACLLHGRERELALLLKH